MIKGCFVLFIVFLILKLLNVINWAWLWVTSPLWVGAIVLIILFIIAVFIEMI